MPNTQLTCLHCLALQHSCSELRQKQNSSEVFVFNKGPARIQVRVRGAQDIFGVTQVCSGSFEGDQRCYTLELNANYLLDGGINQVTRFKYVQLEFFVLDKAHADVVWAPDSRVQPGVRYARLQPSQLRPVENVMVGVAPFSAHGGYPVAQQSIPSVAVESPKSEVGQKIAELARRQIGKPYQLGCVETGFTNASLAQWLHRSVGIAIPDHAVDQAKLGRAVVPAEAAPGDLLFFCFDRCGQNCHVAVCAGPGQLVHAKTPGTQFTLQQLDSQLLKLARAARRFW